MKTFLFLVTTVLLLSISLDAQVTITNQSTYGGVDGEYPGNPLSASDGGFYVLSSGTSSLSGNISVTNYGEDDFFLVKYDANHTIEWQRNYGGTGIDVVYDLYKSDNSLLLVGISNSPVSGSKTAVNRGDWDVWIVKIDLNGNIIWDKTFGGDDRDILKSSDQLSNGNLVLATSSYSGISGNKTTPNKGVDDYWLFEIDGNGDYLWENTLGTDNGDTPADIVAFDNSIFVTGVSMGGINGDKTEPLYGFSDYWIIKTDATGNKVWDRSLGANGINGYSSLLFVDVDSIQVFSVGNVSMSGMRNVPLKGEQDIWSVSLSHNGVVQTQRAYGGDLVETLHSIMELNGNLLLLASSNSDTSIDKAEDSNGGTDFWPILIDKGGDILWQKTIGGSQDDRVSYFAIRPNNKILVSMMSNSLVSGDKTTPHYGGSDIWTIEMDISPLSNEHREFDDFSVYPNPFNQSITLKGEKLENIEKIEIVDPLGKIVLSNEFSKGIKKSTISISTEGLDKGAYVLSVITNIGEMSYRILK